MIDEVDKIILSLDNMVQGDEEKNGGSIMNTDCKRTLNAKLLEEKLKIGWGTSQFAIHLQMSEDEFKNILNDTFKGTAGDSYRRRLKKKDKKIEQQLRRRAASVKMKNFEEKAE